MIDVDERGRAAAADLNRAASASAATDGALQAVLAGGVVVDLSQRTRRRGRVRAASFAAALALTAGVIGVIVARTGGSGGVTVVPASPEITGVVPTPAQDIQPPAHSDETAVTQSTSDALTTATPAAAPNDFRSSALLDVAAADRLPALVAAGDSGVTVDAQTIATGTYDLAVQAPDGSVLLAPVGGGPPLVAADPPTELWPMLSWIGTPVLGDVAAVEGEADVAFTISCGAGPSCRNDVYVGHMSSVGATSRMGVSPSRGGTKLPVTFGRLSLSETGLLVGVSTWDDGRLLHPVVVLPGPAGPDQEPSEFTVFLDQLGLDTGTYSAEEPDRPLAITVDQTGRVVAWVTPTTVQLVDITTGDRRTIPLIARPDAALPVLDIALTGPGLTSGAVLISAPAQSAYVLDLADESLTPIPGFAGTVTFSAVSPG